MNKQLLLLIKNRCTI